MSEDRDFYKTKKGRLLDLRDLGINDLFNLIDNIMNSEYINEGMIEVDKNKAIFIESKHAQNVITNQADKNVENFEYDHIVKKTFS